MGLWITEKIKVVKNTLKIPRDFFKTVPAEGRVSVVVDNTSVFIKV